MRRMDNRASTVPAAPVYNARRRGNEPLFDAQVTSVRAVVQTPEKRCWVEREQVSNDNRNKVPGAIIGAVIGGILGHQVGDGRGRDLATVGGPLPAALSAHRWVEVEHHRSRMSAALRNTAGAGPSRAVGRELCLSRPAAQDTDDHRTRRHHHRDRDGEPRI